MGAARRLPGACVFCKFNLSSSLPGSILSIPTREHFKWEQSGMALFFCFYFVFKTVAGIEQIYKRLTSHT